MAPGMCRRCNRRRAQYICPACTAEEGKRHPLYLRPDLLQGAGYGELLHHGSSLLMINEPGRRVELMNGPLDAPKAAADVPTLLRHLGAEEQAKPFPLLRGDADELHDALATLSRDIDNPEAARALGEIYAFLAALPGVPEEMKTDWASGVRALQAPPNPPLPSLAPAPSRPRAPEASPQGEKLAEWETRLKALADRLAQERADLENTRRVNEEKQTYLQELERTLQSKEENLKSWEARVKEVEASSEKERARTDELMRSLEELQVRMANKEKDLITLEATLGRQQEELRQKEANQGTLEKELLAKAQEEALRGLQEERENVANEGQMVNIWRQALAAKEQELEERMRALDDERKRIAKPAGAGVKGKAR